MKRLDSVCVEITVSCKKICKINFEIKNTSKIVSYLIVSQKSLKITRCYGNNMTKCQFIKYCVKKVKKSVIIKISSKTCQNTVMSQILNKILSSVENICESS